MKRLRKYLAAYSMVLPSMLLFAVFFGAPMILAFVIAFKRIEMAQGIGGSPWVGLQNFEDLFGNVLLAERTSQAFRNTLLFTVCFVPVNLVMSLVLATLIHGVSSRGQSIYRAAFYLPTVTSAVVFALIWKSLYSPNFGLLNTALESIGLPAINWTGDPSWAMWAVIIAALGAGPGGNVLIYLAALGSVPNETRESAKVDGANSLQAWWYVTVPHLRPVTLYLLVLNTIGSFQVFELVFILTSGGPAGSSTVLVYEIYDLAFKQGRYGPAGALSLILLVLVTGIAILQFKFLGSDPDRTAGKPGVLARTFDAIGDRIGMGFGAVGAAWHKTIASFRRKPLRPAPLASPDSFTAKLKREAGLHIILLPLAILFILPMTWMFVAAFTPSVYLNDSPPRISPANLSFENYTRLIQGAPLALRWFWNSTYLSLVVTVIQVMLSCLAGYAFARLEFPGRKLLFGALVASIIVPFQALLIPLFIVMSVGLRETLHLDLMNTHWAIILPSICSPVGIFLMRQFIMNLPRELEEAARIDGCSEWGVWARVILPLCRPMLGAWGILTFTGVWRSFFWPFIVLGSEQLFTLEVGLQTLQQQNVQDTGLVMAGATLSALPMIIIFFIFQKQIVAGLTFGAVKG